MQSFNKIYLGRQRTIQDAIDIADEFLRLALEDERAAEVLCKNHCYNQAAYYYIQSMEKYIKSYICRKVDVTKPSFAEMLKSIGHSLDAAIDLLIEILSGNDEMLKGQIQCQIKENILKNIRFSVLYNAIRYPYYRRYKDAYSITDMTHRDCKILIEIYDGLKNYMKELSVKL